MITKMMNASVRQITMNINFCEQNTTLLSLPLEVRGSSSAIETASPRKSPLISRLEAGRNECPMRDRRGEWCKLDDDDDDDACTRIADSSLSLWRGPPARGTNRRFGADQRSSFTPALVGRLRLWLISYCVSERVASQS